MTEPERPEALSAFVCKECGHAAPADVNAAINIQRRAPVMEPMVRGGLPVATA